MEVLASNIGGTATLIGDPPNIMIGSASGLTFLDFLLNLTPVVVVIFVVFTGVMAVLYRGRMTVTAEVREAVMAIDDSEFISDHRLLRVSLLVLAITIIGFLFASVIHQEPATIALLGAVVLILVARQDPDELIREVDWSTLLFFVGLFVLVEGLVATGVITALGTHLVELTGGDQTVTTLGLLWVSGIASALVDNIPYTRNDDPGLGRAAGGRRPGGRSTVVVTGAGCLPRRQRHDHRGVRQRRRERARSPAPAPPSASGSSCGWAAWWPCSRSWSRPSTSGCATLPER